MFYLELTLQGSLMSRRALRVNTLASAKRKAYDLQKRDFLSAALIMTLCTCRDDDFGVRFPPVAWRYVHQRTWTHLG